MYNAFEGMMIYNNNKNKTKLCCWGWSGRFFRDSVRCSSIVTKEGSGQVLTDHIPILITMNQVLFHIPCRLSEKYRPISAVMDPVPISNNMCIIPHPQVRAHISTYLITFDRSSGMMLHMQPTPPSIANHIFDQFRPRPAFY
mmetsp:Transcript_14235/g.23730  ORF Transcript_14235/g.23730 Transcript_14235/m.23730 type:complete len:142 (-) Transcript_14235:1619-2044(-)